MDILHLLWAILASSSASSGAAWFILRDLISTALWALIVAWALLERPLPELFGGALALVRYGTYGLQLLWRWLRGKPTPPCRPRPGRKAVAKPCPYRKPRRFATPFQSPNSSTCFWLAHFYLLFFN